MPDVTEILARARQGEQAAQAELLPAVYGELRALAASYFRGRSGNTLQPTALVHEAYLRLVRHDAGEIRDRGHFMAIAATAMRQILTDRARRRMAQKRGGPDKERVTLSGVPAWESPIDLVALDDLMKKLETFDARQARLVELRFFAGMTEDETGEALGLSRRTIQKEWRKAKAWLLAELGQSQEA